jgi:hypothetical protein
MAVWSPRIVTIGMVEATPVSEGRRTDKSHFRHVTRWKESMPRGVPSAKCAYRWASCKVPTTTMNARGVGVVSLRTGNCGKNVIGERRRETSAARRLFTGCAVDAAVNQMLEDCAMSLASREG